MLNNRKETYKNYQELFKKGRCSALDVAGAKAQLAEAEAVYGNLEDLLWFNKWKKEQL